MAVRALVMLVVYWKSMADVSPEKTTAMKMT
jgi:hypothetical protein